MPHYENVPFEIPDSWEWIRLSDIASFGGGKTPSMNVKSYWDNGSNLWVTSKDMKRYRIDDSIMKISDEALSIMTQYEPGTILIVTRSGILRHSLPVAILDKKATVNQDLKTISLYLNELNPYIFLTIKANESFILKEYHKDGTTVDSINFEKFSNILLPLPPVREQQHICSAVEELFRLIDDLEANKQNLQDVIKQTKSKVLDLAIHGKLVPQDPTDEPASELLKRINPDAKPCDTSHYENLPKGWAITSMQNVCQLADGEKQEGIERINLDVKYLRGKGEGELTAKGKYVPVDSTMILVDGENSGEIFDTPIEGYQGSTFKLLNINSQMYKPFVLYAIKSHQRNLRENKVGSAIPHLNKKLFREIVIFIPPFAEQKRIVEKVQNIIVSLDNIAAEL